MTEDEQNKTLTIEYKAIDNILTDEQYLLKNQLSFNFESEEDRQEESIQESKQEESIQENKQEDKQEDKQEVIATSEKDTQENTMQEIQPIQEDKQEEIEEIEEEKVIDFDTNKQLESLETQGIETVFTDEMPILLLEESEEEKQDESQGKEKKDYKKLCEDFVLSHPELKAFYKNATLISNPDYEFIYSCFSYELNYQNKQEVAIEEIQEETQENQAIQEESQPKEDAIQEESQEESQDVTFESLFVTYTPNKNKRLVSPDYKSKAMIAMFSKCLEMAIDEKNSMLEMDLEKYITYNPGECIRTASATAEQISTIKKSIELLSEISYCLYDKESKTLYNKKSIYINTLNLVNYNVITNQYFTHDGTMNYIPNWQEIYKLTTSFFQLFNECFSYPEITIDFDTLKILESQENQGNATNEESQNKTYGYVMVYTQSQSMEMQEKHILRYDANAKICKEFIKNNEQVVFYKLLKKLKRGDTLIVDTISKLAINAIKAFKNYKLLFDNEINFISVHESHLNSAFFYEMLNKQNTFDFNTVKNTILATVENSINITFSTFYDMKTSHARQTSKGIQNAKRNGRKAGVKQGANHPPKNKAKNLKRIKSLSCYFQGNLKDVELCAKIGISRPTLIKYKRELWKMQKKE